MGRSGRVLGLLRPYSVLFAANIAATLVSSVMDGATFVLLIPFMRALFGLQALPAPGGSTVEALLAKITGPWLTAAPAAALRNVVLVLLVALVVKNVAAYGAAMASVAIEEGVVRDLRVRLFRHLQTLPLGFFQRVRAGQLLARVISHTDQVKSAATLTSPVSEVFGGVVVVLILAVGTRWALGASASLRPEVFIAFIVVALRLMSPVKAVAQYPTVMAGAGAAADRCFEVLDLPTDEGDAPGAVAARFDHRVEYRQVGFSYDGAAPVLEEVNLEVCRGQVIAIVGPSGAGKTTLVDLLPRFYEPTAGSIRTAGVPFTRCTRRGR